VVPDTPCTSPEDESNLKEVLSQTSVLFSKVMERSSHLAREIESQYGSRPADPEVGFQTFLHLPQPRAAPHELLQSMRPIAVRLLSLCARQSYESPYMMTPTIVHLSCARQF
jgi:hypothetical protein